MPYVSRDDSSNINGIYANLQPGYAEEYLPEDDPEVLAFIESVKPKPAGPTPTDQVLYAHENRIRELEGQPPLSIGEFTKQRQ